MKKHFISVVLVLGILSPLSAFSQGNAYLNAMKSTVSILDTAKTSEGFDTALIRFEQIAGMAKNEWLPLYYKAFCKVYPASLSREENSSEWSEEVLSDLSKAKALKAGESEIYALEAYAYLIIIREDPMKYGNLYATQLRGDLESSLRLNSSNPRAWMIYGMYYYFFPPVAGGNKSKGIECLSKAKGLFLQEKKDGLQPHWGREVNDYIIALDGKSGKE